MVEDEKAVEVVVRLEEETYAAEAGGLGRSLTVRRVAERQQGETGRTNSPESDRTAVATQNGLNVHADAPFYEPYYTEEEFDAHGSGASTPARGLIVGHSAVDFGAARSREQSRERSRSGSRYRQGDNRRLHYAASMASAHSNYSGSVFGDDKRVTETRWI